MYKIRPVAYGKILGGPLAPEIYGHIYFFNAAGGTEIQIINLMETIQVIFLSCFQIRVIRE